MAKSPMTPGSMFKPGKLEKMAAGGVKASGGMPPASKGTKHPKQTMTPVSSDRGSFKMKG